MIHKYKLNGYNIVTDTNSGAIHLVDDVSFDILGYVNDKIDKDISEDIYFSLGDKYSEKEIQESYKELYELYKQGALFSEDGYGEMAEVITKDLPIKSMCINIAHDCNLRCEYCFAEKGDFGGARELMTKETGKKAIDFLVSNSGERHNLEVDFFGGEPLMNFDTVKFIVMYARSIEEKHDKNFRFTITTNGLLLTDDKIDFINKEMNNVVLSLDGRKAVNDTFRLTKDGRGSYDIILPKFKKTIEQRGDKDYYIRGTYTGRNLDFADDVEEIYNLGFNNISLEPVVSDKNLEYSIKQENLKDIFCEYERLARKIIELKKNGSDINFFHFALNLEHSPCAIRRIRSCGCGNEYVAVTPNGDIFPCHQFVGDDDWKMGNLNDETFDHGIKKKFSESNIYTKNECKSCWAKFYCSGGCNANNLHYAGEILNPHKLSCEIHKKRIECAIMVKAALS